MLAKRDDPSPLRLLPADEVYAGYGGSGAGGKMMLTVLLPSATTSPSQLTPADSQPVAEGNVANVDLLHREKANVCLPSDNTSSSAPSMTTGPPTGPQFLLDEPPLQRPPQPSLSKRG